MALAAVCSVRGHPAPPCASGRGLSLGRGPGRSLVPHGGRARRTAISHKIPQDYPRPGLPGAEGSGGGGGGSSASGDGNGGGGDGCAGVLLRLMLKRLTQAEVIASLAAAATVLLAVVQQGSSEKERRARKAVAQDRLQRDVRQLKKDAKWLKKGMRQLLEAHKATQANEPVSG